VRAAEVTLLRDDLEDDSVRAGATCSSRAQQGDEVAARVCAVGAAVPPNSGHQDFSPALCI
jgi:hypothetical protein